MKKSVYSLMLFDEIVEKIDQIAYANNTNRSQLINDILAEKIGLETPEQKVQKILEQLDANLTDTLSVSQVNKNSSIQFGKSLKYKYRPKIRYSYEFVNGSGGRYAVLKVSSRTKSEDLNEHFDQFFKKIHEVERKNLPEDLPVKEKLTNHKFIREFQKDGSIAGDVDQVSNYLTDYLKMIDSAMNLYFSDTENEDFEAELNEIYHYYF
ncbi:MAG: hypothetical protein Q4C55_09470 [Eubacterium sp.]|nr:hypothetical protein [Eubacterium sp.]